MTLGELLATKEGVRIVARVFKAGFAASAEGFNAEYGADHTDVERELQEWLTERTEGKA